MAYDFKKALKDLYAPGADPALIDLPPANYLAVEGSGDPNEVGGAYQQAISALYAVAYTLKMSHRTDHRIEGFFEYVVPPLEGLWHQADTAIVDLARKSDFRWTSFLRLPEFVREQDVAWAVETASKKKKMNCSAVHLLSFHEGLCVQALHTGPFDTEAETVEKMDAWLEELGYVNDFSPLRRHHEIYLSDPRKTPPERRKTILRHPVRKT